MLKRALGTVCAVIVAAPAMATPVSLTTWTAESYPAVSGFGAGSWTVAAGGASVTQSVNGQPTVFYSDFNAVGSDVRGKIRVNSNNDDDYIGFALGFDPGDSTNLGADYLLIDWKRADQFFDFGTPSTTPGSTAQRGLALSEVNGVPTADEFWGHTNFASHTGGGVTELARGTTLFDSPWLVGTEYEFRFIFQADRVRVFVDDVQQFDITGSFSDGRLAFYNFSQADVTYSAFEVESVPPVSTPEPASALLLGAGLAGLGLVRRRTRRA